MNKKKKSVSQLDGMVLKTNLKQKVYLNTVASFDLLKEVLNELAEDYRGKLKDKVDENLLPAIQEKGLFEAEFRIGGDVLIFSIFKKHENHFFVEGKRQSSELVKDYVNDKLSKEYMKEIIETSIQYAIDFDLLVPPYDQVKIASVEQMHDEIYHSKIQTGKRLGFKFNSDDI